MIKNYFTEIKKKWWNAQIIIKILFALNQKINKVNVLKRNLISAEVISDFTITSTSSRDANDPSKYGQFPDTRIITNENSFYFGNFPWNCEYFEMGMNEVWWCMKKGKKVWTWQSFLIFLFSEPRFDATVMKSLRNFLE